jgi:hypothetical protein
MKKTLLFTTVLLLLNTVLFGQCLYPLATSQAGSTITYCIDSNNTQTVTTNAGQYVLVNVIQGYNYTFSVPDIAGFAGNENLTIYDATNTTTFLANSTGASGTSITWTATLSGQIKVLLSKGACVNDGTVGGSITLKLNAVGDTSTYLNDIETAAGNNTWVGHVYNFTGGVPPGGVSPATLTSGTPFLPANYVGYYLEPTQNFTQNFIAANDTSCFPVYSNNAILGSILNSTFAVRYRMNSTLTGCYIASVSGDDGVRLYLDGKLVFDAWVQQATTAYANVLISLTGNNSLVFDYYENYGGNTAIVSLTPFSTATNTITAPTTTTVCSGTSPTAIVGSNYIMQLTTPSPSVAYQWQISTDGGITFTDIIGATAKDYTPAAVSTSVSVTTKYQRLVKPAIPLNSPSCSASNQVSITTGPIVATIAAPILNVCNATLTSGSLGGNVPATGNTGAWTLISGPGTVVFSSPNTATSTAKVSAVGAYVFRWKVTSGSCSNYADLTVNYGVTPILNAPLATLCTGNTFQLTPSTGGIWSSSNSSAASVSASGLITGISGDTGITFTFTSSLAGSCTAATSAVAINSLTGGVITANNSGTQSPACGGPINPNTTLNTTSATGLGSITYQWQSSTDNVAFSNIPGATSNTYAFTGGFAVTSYFIRVATSTLNGVACTANSNTLPYVINTLPTVASITPGGTTNVCPGNTLQLSDATSLISNVWSSSNNLFATVDSTGLVTGLTAGAGYSVTISYKATDSNGCYKTANKTVGILTIVAPAVTVVNNCGMGTTTLSTNALGALLWSTGETTSSITVSTAGSYTVKSTLNGCVSNLGAGIAAPLLSPLIP